MKEKKLDFLEMMLDTSLDEKVKLDIKATEDEFIRNLQKIGKMEVTTYKDYMKISHASHYYTIMYLITEIQLIILKYNLQKGYDTELTEEEILDYVKKIKINKIILALKKLDVDLPLKEKQEILKNIDIILNLEKNCPHSVFNSDREKMFLSRLQNYELKLFSSYKYCVDNLKSRKKLQELGIQSHVAKKIELLSRQTSELEEKQKRKF